MKAELRKTGIKLVGDIPWGTHSCHFYETKDDFLDILIPYFKAGLENNEFCIWVVSNSGLITIEEAKAALEQAVPDLDRHLSEKNIEILNGLEWYLEEDVFNLERVIAAWDAKLKQALDRGFAGMRVSGDTFWLAEKDRKDFFAYEKQLNESIADKPMTLLCTYPLEKSGAAEVFDVLHVHQFAIARRQGEWEIIQSPEPIQARAEIKRLNNELNRVSDRKPEPPAILRYGVAILAVTAALIINQLLNVNLVGAPAMLFLCSLMFSAWYGGVKPSLVAMPFAVLAFAYFFVTPVNSWSVDVREIPRLSLFVLASLFVISLSAAQRRGAESLRHARDVLAGTVEELKRTNEALHTENAERKQAESLLHVKEQEFRAIVENAPDQIIRYDREFRRVYVNPAVAKAYGLPAEALTGTPLGSVLEDAGVEVTEDELRQLRQQIATVFDTGKSSEFEITWPLPTGRNVFSIRMVPELDLNGSVINVLGIARDITERRIAEEELKKEKEILEKIFENIPVMIGFVGNDGAVKLVNPEWERTIGWTLKELQEQNVDIFEEAYPDLSYRREVLKFVAAATGNWVDLKIKVRDGRVIDAACAMVRLSDGTRVAIAQDITERKQAEEKLVQSERQLAEAQHIARVGSWNWDIENNVVTWSDEVYRIFGIKPQEFGSTFEAYFELVHPEDRDFIIKIAKNSFGKGEPFSYYYRIIRPDGEVRTLYSHRNVFTDERGNLVRSTGTLQDVTERMRAEEQLQSSNEKLRALATRLLAVREEESIRIAREIHDELGSVLTGLKMDISWLSKKLTDQGDAALQKKFREMSELIDETVQKVRNISTELRPAILDDLGLAAAIESQCREFQKRTDIKCRIISLSEETELHPDKATALFRIFQEILTNIARHSGATSIEISMEEVDVNLVLKVSDNGKGIKESNISDPKSLGILGMLERAFVFGGQIEITGEEGKGTAVTVRIPRG